MDMSAKRESWDSERIEQMKRCLHDGMTCSQVARALGVTRNAVIGKLHRLGLTRPRDLAAGHAEHRRAARLARPRTPRTASPRTWLPRRLRLSMAAQHELLVAAYPASAPRVEDVPIHEGRGCTLLELNQGRCRWPISTPGAADFCFCGNAPVEGLPYCPGHARIAYRPAGRRSA
jgi:GcrA cell cycle regulator